MRGKQENQDESQTDALPAFESHPPRWLPKIHDTGDLGYTGFHPPRPGQDEDILSENNVKNGFMLGQPVSVETFSAQTMINEKLHTPDALSHLEELMNEIFARRVEQIPPIPSSSFRIPTRVTLNDAKRQAWIADLANPDVPLQKLGKSVPHGARGHDLLDLLHTHDVEVSRAVWFLRVFGANETAGLRNKPNYVPTQYSVDWANLVTAYLRKLIAEIALPNAPRPGLNIKSTFKGVLSETESRDRWMSRFVYCLNLLRTFYSEGLVDHRTFLTWLVFQMITCNLAQAGFVTRLLDNYLDDMLSNRAFTRPLVEACLVKLSEIRSTSAHGIMKDTDFLLRLTLQRICLSLPDSFMSPKMWNTYSSILDSIFSENLVTLPTDRSVQQNIDQLRQILVENSSGVKRRNEATLFMGQMTHVSDDLGTAVSYVKLLNSISSETDLYTVPYFSHSIDCHKAFRDRMDTLLTWSVTPLQYGEHRPFAAVTLIRIWRDRAYERASRREVETPNEFLQDQLFDWLDASDVAGDPNNIRDVALLYGKFVKHTIFSYDAYIQRLIARAETGLSFNEENGSRHRLFLSWIPLFNTTPSLVNQRKVTLYGARTREMPEEANERGIRNEIRAVLPQLFEGPHHKAWISALALKDCCQLLVTATRFEQVRTFRQWLLPHFRNCMLKAQHNHSFLFDAYFVAIELMSFAKCYHSMLDLTLSMLDLSEDPESMSGIIGTLCRYALIWNCMDTIDSIVKALEKTHLAWRQRGMQSRALLALLVKLDNHKYLDEVARQRIDGDMYTFTLALRPNDNPCQVPDHLPEILLLAADVNPNAPSILANGLWIKYRSSSNWGWKVWDNTVASLRQIPSMTTDAEAQHVCALRYGMFLWKVDQHLPNSLDADVLQWFHGPGHAEVSALTDEVWDVLKVVVLYLAVNGALKTTTIMEGLVYPAWQMGASGMVPEGYLAAANTLCDILLLQESGTGTSVPPSNLFEIQSIRTRRQDVYDEQHFAMLVASIPALISLETNVHVPEHLQVASAALRSRICWADSFRQGGYRNLDVVRQAFDEYLTHSTSSSEELSKREISGLRMILSDIYEDDKSSAEGWPEVYSLLSPWKIAATTIQMQIQVKQLGRALAHESTSQGASSTLDKLIMMLFRQLKTSEEAYYIGEMVRDADSAVAAKFLNIGLQSITDLLSSRTTPAAGIHDEGLKQAGELLRVLVHLSHPFRDGPATFLTVEAHIQEGFLQAIDSSIRPISSQNSEATSSETWRDNLVLLCRLLQFILSFKCAWTAKSKDTCKKVTNTLFSLLCQCASEEFCDLNLYPILLDTVLVAIDDLPQDKHNNDLFRHYMTISEDAISKDIPPECRKQIISLSTLFKSETVVTDLVGTYHDSSGEAVYGSAVSNRPWEWIENLGEPSLTDADEIRREREDKHRTGAAYVVKNSGSIPLEHFGARHTGDRIKRYESDDWETTTRSLEDGFSESIHIRDWLETRKELERDPSPGATAALAQAAALATTKALGGGSPASSASSSQFYQQEGQSQRRAGSMHDIIDVDSIASEPSGSRPHAGKRKAPPSTVSDDEVEIIEGPIPRQASGKTKRPKAGKAPSTAKSKVKKR